MTDDTPTPETAEWEADEPDEPGSDTTLQTAPATDQQPPPPGMKYDATGKLLIEAEPHSREAKYRTQLRAAEAERDQLKERLERRDKADVERMIQSKLIDPADLWAAGVTLADVCDPDTGEISPQLVDEAVTRVVKQHPHWRYSAAAPASQVTSPHAGITDEQQPTWQQLFQQATRPK
jgi:hypothetical protein